MSSLQWMGPRRRRVVMGMVAVGPVPCYSSLINSRGGAQRLIGEGHRSSVGLNEYGVITPIDDSDRVLSESS
jgi:hypothetical protein